jgi:hypothetical protein
MIRHSGAGRSPEKIPKRNARAFHQRRASVEQRSRKVWQ